MRRKKAHRMRIECRDNRRFSCRSGLLYRLAGHRLMAQMEAIEIAQRHDCAA